MASAESARARFDAAVTEHLTAPLAEGITLSHVTQPEVMASIETLWKADPRPVAKLAALYTAEESERIADLGAALGSPLSHCIRFQRGDEVVGAYWGLQESWGRYYMVSSILVPELQGRGLYKAFLDRVVAAAAASGFAEVYSRHRVDNNAILVPKLKAGFAIAGFEIAPRWGLLVHLRRYLIEGLDHTFRYRIDGVHAAELRTLGVLPDS